MMRYKIIFSFLFLLSNFVAYSQFLSNKPYAFSSEIYDSINVNSQKWNRGYTAPMLSFIGLYKQALSDDSRGRMYVQRITKEDSLNLLKKYRAINAKKYIIDAAKKNRVIIINEAHFNPRHRVFIASLLKDLKKVGYSYFAAEGFWNNEKFLRQFPSLKSGYYTKEPQFGNLIRKAINQNFTLMPYEDTTGGNGKFREINQAKNLATLLNSNRANKIVIYCGYAHVYEDSLGGGWEKAMAGRLQEYTGINPYTIDQTLLVEKATYETSLPLYRIHKSNQYSFLIDRANKIYTTGKVDAVLFSPPTKYIYNRPHWIFENNKKPYLLNNIKTTLKYPLLIKVYLNEEEIQNNYVPIDIIEIKNAVELSATAVAVEKKGKFIIQIEDKTGTTKIFRPKL